MIERSAAERDWRRRIGRPSDRPRTGHGMLPPPAKLVAQAETGYVLLDWSPVPDALGYLVYSAQSPDGRFQPIDHHGGDVLAVPRPPYADTTRDGRLDRWYAVATWTDDGPGDLSSPVAAQPPPDGSRLVAVHVDSGVDVGQVRPIWRRVLGSEHLSLLAVSPPGPGGSNISDELATALHSAHRDLGVEYIRAHGTFLPEMAQRIGDRWDFSGLDVAYDRMLGIGLRPIVELSFMPAELASDPSARVFEYGAVVSPPRDWSDWAELCAALADHLIDRYGRDEVRSWMFEVWNEANLEVFWSGSQEDYFRLYDIAVGALRSVDPQLRVGGPSSARAEWVGALLAHTRGSGTPIDFVSTHTYGNAPLDLRPLVADRAPAPEIWWTEWGVSPTHGHEVNDSVYAAAFVLHGVAAALDTADAVGYWVVSDQFEELGWPPALFHGGFGLLSVGNLRKPRWWALELLGRLGRRRLSATVSGDGVGLVDCLATGADNGCVRVLLWNFTLDQTKSDGDARLDRTVRLRVDRLPAGSYRATLHRIDERHGNIASAWRALGSPPWPDQPGWAALRAADRLDPAEPEWDVAPVDGVVEREIDIPMPGVALLTLEPRPG